MQVKWLFCVGQIYILTSVLSFLKLVLFKVFLRSTFSATTDADDSANSSALRLAIGAASEFDQ